MNAALKEAIHRKRQQALSHSKAAEHEEVSIMDGKEKAPDGVSVHGEAEHEEVGPKLRSSVPSKMHISDKTDHDSDVAVSMQDDDGDDDGEIIKHMTHGMNEHDMEHSVSSKPKSLGDRVRQMAVLKSKK